MFEKDYLIEEYINKKKTTREIGKQNNVDKSKICYWLKKHNIEIRKSGRQRNNNILGKTYGSLKVVEFIEADEKCNLKIKCQCDCGEICLTSYSNLNSGQKTCWDCRNKIISDKKWLGYEEISGEFWGKIKNSAKIRNLTFDLTIDYIWDLYLSQNKICALSGVDISFFRTRADRNKTTASLDRIDSSKGYIVGNVQWVHKIVNNLKMDLSEGEFLNWCKKIVKHHE